MRKVLIAICIIALGAIILGTWMFIRNSEQAYEEGLTEPFDDVEEGQWYYNYIAKAYNKGWVEGLSLTQFQPDAPLQRGDFALMLYRYLGAPDTAGFHNPFTDLEDLECKNAVIYLHKLEVLDGKTETTFAPQEGLTREQMVTMLYRLGGYRVHEELSPSGKFVDRDHISSWAMEAVDWAIDNGLLTGVTETMLSPGQPATRAQAVKVLYVFGEKAGFQTNTADPERAVTIKVWQAGVDDSNAALTMKKLLNRFEKKNPNITVEYTPIPARENPYEKIQDALKKGEGPDVLMVSAPYEMLLADEGLILPVDTLLTEEAMKDLHPALLIDCSYDRSENPELKGRLVSVPLFATPRALLLNRSIFDHFGIHYPDNTFTYDTMLSNARSLTGSKDGKVVYGLGARASSPCLYLGMLWSTGGRIRDPITGKASTNNSMWRRTTEAYLRLYADEVTPDHSVAMDYNSQLGMFAKGNVAMIDASLNAASLIQDKENWKENLAVYPFLDNTQPACLCVGEVAAISKHTENIVDAAKLINFLMEPDSQIIYAKGVGYLPGVFSALEESDLGKDPYLSPYVIGVEDTEALGDKGYAVYCLIRDELQKVLRKELTVEAYCEGLEQQINDLLRE
ncbi:MAG: extracellular solute-binding protein [Oscillospiraceae bacterium]|nr:extracellular solute-binding protein [Oscillospiraceae bacterium]